MWNLAMSIGIPALGVLVIGLFLYMIESMGQPVMSQEAPSMTKLALVFFIIGGGYLLWLTWALLRDYRDLKRAEILSVAQRAEGEPDALRIRSRRGSVVETEENELRA
jgi:threonine/homoserine/homoserine lactone efflux protein